MLYSALNLFVFVFLCSNQLLCLSVSEPVFLLACLSKLFVLVFLLLCVYLVLSGSFGQLMC